MKTQVVIEDLARDDLEALAELLFGQLDQIVDANNDLLRRLVDQGDLSDDQTVILNSWSVKVNALQSEADIFAERLGAAVN